MLNQAPTAAEVVLDASFVIALCAKEPGRHAKAQAELQRRVQAGSRLYAPHLLVMECTFVFCNKLQAGVLTNAEHGTAVANLLSLCSILTFLAGNDAALLSAAETIRTGYGCSRSADSFYLALAERLGGAIPSEVLTFDDGLRRQAAQASLLTTVTVFTP